MLFVLPATSAPHFATPQSRECYPTLGCRPRYDAPRFVSPSYQSYPSFFRQPSVEELEEREYLQALEVVANHRRRQVEKEAAIYRQQLAETARQRYFAAFAKELEQRRQEELLAARRAELIHLQQAQARLAAAERQHALNAFLRQAKGPQPITRQPHVAKRKPLADALQQRLAAEPDADIAEPIKNILSSLEPHHAVSDEDSSKFVENLLSSVFPGFITRTQPQPTSPSEQVPSSVSEKGKGKAPAADVKVSPKPEQKPESAKEAFADILRHIADLSKSSPSRSSAEASLSASPSPPTPSTQPVTAEEDVVRVERAKALSSVKRVQNTLSKLQTDFVFPTELDHYTPTADDRDETNSVSSVSSSDLTKLIPYTSTNKPIYKYENELNGLLEELDRIDSNGDSEVRGKRREVVKAVEKALESVEQVVSEVVEKRLSLVSAATSTTHETTEGLDIDEVTEEGAPVQEQVDTPIIVGDVAVSEPFVPTQEGETVIAPSPAEEPLPEPDTPIVSDTSHLISTEPDADASMETIILGSESPQVQLAAETGTTESPTEIDVPVNADASSLPEKAFSPSPVREPERVDSDSDDDVLSLDSDAEKDDWTEIAQ